MKSVPLSTLLDLQYGIFLFIKLFLSTYAEN